MNKKSCIPLLTEEKDYAILMLHSATMEGGQIMINSAKIKERMNSLGVKQKDIASILGVKAPTVSQKINGVRPMDLDEAKKLANFLNIDPDEFGSYFFAS